MKQLPVILSAVVVLALLPIALGWSHPAPTDRECAREVVLEETAWPAGLAGSVMDELAKVEAGEPKPIPPLPSAPGVQVTEFRRGWDWGWRTGIKAQGSAWRLPSFPNTTVHAVEIEYDHVFSWQAKIQNMNPSAGMETPCYGCTNGNPVGAHENKGLGLVYILGPDPSWPNEDDLEVGRTLSYSDGLPRQTLAPWQDDRIDWTGPDAHEFPVVTEVRHNRLVMTDPAILARVQGSVPSLAEGDEWGVLLINGWLLRAQGAPSTPYAHDMDGRAYFAEVIVRVHWSPAN